MKHWDVKTIYESHESLAVALNVIEQNGQSIFAVQPWSRHYEVRGYPCSEHCWNIICYTEIGEKK